MKPNYAQRILALDDERLEAFIKSWLARRTHEYPESERFSGPGDKGRDVVGYRSASLRHEGPWDNFQCKQLTTRLSEFTAINELGKIFMHSASDAYSLPSAYTFVAPRGVVRAVKDYIAHPEKFRKSCIENWDEYCKNKLVAGKEIPLTPEILKKINEFDFSRVYSLTAIDLEEDPYIMPALVEWFDADPGPAPIIDSAPEEIGIEEAGYLQQLTNAYSERENSKFEDTNQVLAHPKWGRHLKEQRLKFFDAAEFERFYRDSAPQGSVDNFINDIYHGTSALHYEEYSDLLSKVNQILSHAATISPSGPFAKHARTSVKQGVCHHLANNGKLEWK